MTDRIFREFSVFFVLTFLCILIPIVGCNESDKPKNSNVARFSSDDSLKSYLVEQYAKSSSPYSLRTMMIEGDTANETSADGGSGHSETNLQESGVDESDVVKTDGEYLYIVAGKGVRIVSAMPPETMRVMGELAVDGNVDSIYLYGGKLVVIYRPAGAGGEYWRGEVVDIGVGMPYWIPIKEQTGILIADVANPASPEVIRNVLVDGYLSASRLTGGRLHVILQFLPDLPPLDIWYDGTEAGKATATAANMQALSSLTLDAFLPSCKVYDGAGAIVREGRAIRTEDFICPISSAGGSMVSIITVDVGNPTDDFISTGFVADVHHVYASTTSLYLVSTLYHYAEGQNGQDTSVIWESPTFETQIYKFDLNRMPVALKAGGRVAGEILNQFSMGEYAGALRIATSTGSTWDGTAKNHVFCLTENAEKLDVIGSIRDIAPGERLYSARFMGKRGFLVTFVQVDPLFTLDLSDPANPVILGELKVPGYSTYLHPLNDNYLLALGQDTFSDGDVVRVGGLQLSIFDISNFADPKLVHSRVIGDRGTYSEALYNHKALTFWPERNLLAIPVSLYEYVKPPESPWEYASNTFNGLYVYRLSDTYDFDFLGRMDVLARDESRGEPYAPSWSRGVFMGAYVYAATPATVTAAPVDHIDEPVITLDLMP
jgi:inhibitor of cysteine peptidase